MTLGGGLAAIVALDRNAAAVAAVARRGDVRGGGDHLRRCQPALLVVAHVPHRGALRLQPDDAAALADRPRQGHGRRDRARAAAAGAGAVADARGGTVLVAVGVARVDGLPAADPGALPDADRAAVQQVLADGREPGARARRGAARALRLPQRGPVRDGRFASAPATATRTSPASARPSASCSSTRCSTASRPTRSRPCSRTSSATSSDATSPSASCGPPALSLAVLALLAWFAGAPLVLRRPRHSGRMLPVAMRAPGRRAGAVPAGAAGVHVRAGAAVVAVLAQARVRGGCVRHAHMRRPPRSCWRW